MSKRLILLELNEVNFELAKPYVERGGLPSFQRMLSQPVLRTRSEARYELLEPWIQWVSAHCGKDAASHGVFRLGDIVGSGVPQFFEAIERAGVSVGNVCAMNAENGMAHPAYFIPDPWTHTPTDGSWWSRALREAIGQAVNDNAQSKVSAKSMAVLAAGLLRFAQPANYELYLKLALRSRRAPWRKALLLDLLLHDIHLRLFRSRRPGLSTLFLNAGAHIQHHYFLNARHAVNTKVHNPAWYVDPAADPFAEMLQVYDRILSDYFRLEGVDLIVATGLTQVPYDRVKYYWRLKDHIRFLRMIGIGFRRVLPRMARDFLIEFDSAEDACRAQDMLAAVRVWPDGSPLFEEIDNRGLSLFVSLTWTDDISEGLTLIHPGGRDRLRPHVEFVALKNGMHHAEGFVFYEGSVSRYAAPDQAHVKDLYGVVMKYFELDTLPETGVY